MKIFFLSLAPMIPPKRSDIFSPDWEMLIRSRRVLIFLDGNGPGDIWGTTVRNKDEELKTFWDLSMVLREYRMGD